MFKKANIKNFYLSNELIANAMIKRRRFAVSMIANVCEKKIQIRVVK